MKLYEIAHEYRKALDAVQVDEETGEILGLDQLQLTGEEAKEKICAALCVIKETEADISSLRDHLANISRRKKSLENKQERLKSFVMEAMAGLGVEKVKNTVISGYLRKSEVIVVDDIKEIPEGYLKIEYNPDKALIKDALKRGLNIQGTHLEANQSLIIR